MSALKITKSQARKIWMHAQGLSTSKPFGSDANATIKAIRKLGYVQIDTINVIERCHHHILFTRIPDYRRSHLHKAQSINKTIFEYWTHALSYVPIEDYRYFVNNMQVWKNEPNKWYSSVTKRDVKNMVSSIAKQGPISIRDVSDQILIEKTHPWGSRKPAKGVLQTAFHSGELVISERQGMLKKYEITDRHFGWQVRPKPATKSEVIAYKVDRALRSQGIISVNSTGHLEKAPVKKELLKNIEKRVKVGSLVPVQIEGIEKIQFWGEPNSLQDVYSIEDNLTHLLSPFDPLVIQRKRFQEFFEHDHKFEAYIPKEKRIFGYFALPVLIEDKVAAVIDLKADRQKSELLIQQWTWLKKSKSTRNKALIESALDRFEKFQFELP